MRFSISNRALQLPVLLLAAGARMFGGAINFDDLATGPGAGGSIALGNQYLAQGVVFSNVEASKAFTFNITPNSSPNYASPFFNSTNPGSFQFVDPVTLVPAYVTSLQFTLLALTSTPAHPGFYSGATIEALDFLGNVIAGDTQVIPAASASDSDVVLSFTGKVHEIRFTHTTGTNGLLPFDDVTFGALTATPEPSGGLLAGSAILLALLGLRRRTA